jgi:hypothetical protein
MKNEGRKRGKKEKETSLWVQKKIDKRICSNPLKTNSDVDSIRGFLAKRSVSSSRRAEAITKCCLSAAAMRRRPLGTASSADVDIDVGG